MMGWDGMGGEIGLLVYPHMFCGPREPMNSMRMKKVREVSHIK